MNRAYIGFSTPVAYDYKNETKPKLDEETSSPNPVLVGITGLLVLFDEIWFACRSICPASMRELPYVKFVSEEYKDFIIDVDRASDIAAEAQEEINYDSVDPEGFEGFIGKYYGSNDAVDNHTHGISWLGSKVFGSANYKNLILDLVTLDQLDQLDLSFSHSLNTLTRKLIFPQGLEWLRNDSDDKAVGVVDRALTISSIYDLTGPGGPYHPVMEELRNHNFISSFREWVHGQTSSLHNQSIEDIVEELNAVTREFEQRSLHSAIGKNGLRDVSITLLKGMFLDAIPGSGSVKNTLDIIEQKRHEERRKTYAYLAESTGAMWQAHQKSKVHIY